MGKIILSFIITLFINFSYPQMTSDSLALKLLEVTKSKEAYDNTIALMLVEHNSLYGKNYELLHEFIWKYFNYDSVKSNYASLYSEEFTDNELEQLIEFYNTDIGKKLVNKSSIMIAKSLRYANERYQQKLPILDSLLREEYLTFLRDTSTVFTDQKESIKYLDEKELNNLLANKVNYEECDKFKVGKYVIKDNEFDFYCVRDKDSQHEISEYLNIDAEFKVEWLNNCEYNLIFINNTNKKFDLYKPGDIVNIKILEIRDKEYDCIIDFNNNKSKVTMVKIE